LGNYRYESRRTKFPLPVSGRPSAASDEATPWLPDPSPTYIIICGFYFPLTWFEKQINWFISKLFPDSSTPPAAGQVRQSRAEGGINHWGQVGAFDQ
jgi:hypothetical protein